MSEVSSYFIFLLPMSNSQIYATLSGASWTTMLLDRKNGNNYLQCSLSMRPIGWKSGLIL